MRARSSGCTYILRAHFVADVHGNLEALEAVSVYIKEGPIYVLGDMVGYGANPNEVLDKMRQWGALCILGNHDHAVLTGDVSWFNHHAAQAALWTKQVLSNENRVFLSSLPQTRVVEIQGLRVFMAHGSPLDPLSEYVYPTSHLNLFEYYLTRFKAKAVALGHTHVPFLWTSEQGIVFNPGSVGQPRSGDPRACFAEVDSDGEHLQVEHRLVTYDFDKAAKKILDAGLPSFLAHRLYEGV